MVIVTSVVEWALVEDVMLILGLGAMREVAAGALSRLISRGSEFCSICPCEIVVS